MGGIHREKIHPGFGQGLRTFHGVRSDPDRRSHSQSALVVQKRLREIHSFVDVREGDQSLEHALFVDQRKLFDAMAVQKLARLFQGHSGSGRHQVLRGHQLADVSALAFGQAQIAIGKDAHQLAGCVADGKSRDLAGGHDLESFLDGIFRRQRDRMVHHARLPPLHPHHVRGLLRGLEVLVDDPQAPLAGKRDGELGAGDGVHRSAQDGNVQGKSREQFRGDGRIGRQHFAVRGDEEHVVEGECFGDVCHGRFPAMDETVSPHGRESPRERKGRDETGCAWEGWTRTTLAGIMVRANLHSTAPQMVYSGL